MSISYNRFRIKDVLDIGLGEGFTFNDVQYPPNWAVLATQEELDNIGMEIYTVTVDGPVKNRYFDKVDFWRKTTNQEAEQIEQTIENAPIKLKRLWIDGEVKIDLDSPEGVYFRNKFVELFGEERTQYLMDPLLI